MSGAVRHEECPCDRTGEGMSTKRIVRQVKFSTGLNGCDVLRLGKEPLAWRRTGRVRHISSHSTTPTPTPTRPTRLLARFPREDVGVVECGLYSVVYAYMNSLQVSQPGNTSAVHMFVLNIVKCIECNDVTWSRCDLYDRARQLYKNISMLFLFPVKDGKHSTGVNATFDASCYG